MISSIQKLYNLVLYTWFIKWKIKSGDKIPIIYEKPLGSDLISYHISTHLYFCQRKNTMFSYFKRAHYFLSLIHPRLSENFIIVRFMITRICLTIAFGDPVAHFWSIYDKVVSQDKCSFWFFCVWIVQGFLFPDWDIFVNYVWEPSWVDLRKLNRSSPWLLNVNIT